MQDARCEAAGARGAWARRRDGRSAHVSYDRTQHLYLAITPDVFQAVRRPGTYFHVYSVLSWQEDCVDGVRHHSYAHRCVW